MNDPSISNSSAEKYENTSAEYIPADMPFLTTDG